MNRIYIFSFLTAGALITGGCGQSGYNVNVAAPNTNRASMNAANNANATPSNSASSTNLAARSSDEDFMIEAAQGGMAEVELGRMAATKAASAEVKKFGQMMVTDHSKANEELKALAAKKGVKLPAELDPSQKATVEKLKGLVGAEFDKEYVEDMVDDHEKDVAKFEEMAKSATDPDVKAFAAKTLPTLKKHLDAIKAIQPKMK